MAAKSPKSGGLAFHRVIIDCRDSIKRLIKLKKVVPSLVESEPGRARMPKKVGKKVTKGSGDLELLLGWINLSVDNFIAFLEVLQSTSDDEGHRVLMKVLSRSLPSLRVEPGSDAEAKVKKFLAATVHVSGRSVDPVPAPALELAVHSQATFLSETLATAELTTDISHDETVHQHVGQPSLPPPEAKSQHSDSSPATVSSPPLMTSTVHVSTGLPDSMRDDVTPQGPNTTYAEQRPSDTGIETSPQTSLPYSKAKTMQSESDMCSDTVLMKTTTQQQQPVQPPPGFLGYLSERFTSNGGELYCPEYGILVSIPSRSVPPSIDCFLLSVYIYLRGPFAIPDDAELCTPVLWFSLKPSFTFVDDITLMFPHSAFIPCSADLHQLTLWRAADLLGSTYVLSERVKADFSDCYHVVALVRHFSPYCATVTKKRGKRRRASSKGNKRQPKSRLLTAQEQRRALKRLQGGSSSVDSHSSVDSEDLSRHMDEQMLISASTISAEQPQLPDESTDGPTPSASHSSTAAHQSNPNCFDQLTATTPVNQFIVRKCVPRDRSVSSWEAVFYVCYHNTAGDKAIRLAAESRFGHDGYILSALKKFHFSPADLLEFHPLDWTEDEWNVFVTDGNEIEREYVVQINCDGTSVPTYPPDVTYAVQTRHPPSIPLKCKVEVLGVLGRGKLQYMLTSTSETAHPPPVTSASRSLTVSPWLYTRESQLLQFLAQARQNQAKTPSVILDLGVPDHQMFLAEISLQSNKPRELSQALQLPEYQIHRILADYRDDEAEQVYHVLATWTSRRCPKPTLQQLLHLIGRIEPRLDSERLCIDPNLENNSISDRKFIVTISKKLQLRWKFVGRLLGIPHPIVEGIVRDYQSDINEQSYQMLQKWQQRYGNSATYGALSSAVDTVYSYDPGNVSDAYFYIKDRSNLH